MKLGPEHIGKKVRSSYGSDITLEIRFIGEHEFIDEKGLKWPIIPANDDWQLVEEKKKPSERIEEIYRDPNSLNGGNQFRAIIQYLDETEGER